MELRGDFMYKDIANNFKAFCDDNRLLILDQLIHTYYYSRT